MLVKCSGCNIEDRGQYKKLVERGWKIFFLGNDIRIARCGKCRPVFPDFYYEVGTQMNKLKIINNLKTREELNKEIYKRTRKRKYHYRRNKK